MELKPCTSDTLDGIGRFLYNNQFHKYTDNEIVNYIYAMFTDKNNFYLKYFLAKNKDKLVGAVYRLVKGYETIYCIQKETAELADARAKMLSELQAEIERLNEIISEHRLENYNLQTKNVELQTDVEILNQMVIRRDRTIKGMEVRNETTKIL